MLILFLLSLSGHSESRLEFLQFYHWKTKPQVVLCDDAKVSKLNLEKAMKYWKSHTIDMHDTLIIKKCKKSHRKGEIRFTNQRDLDTSIYYGFTSRDTDFYTDEIKAATVMIEDNESSNIVLITHELGHALGLNHSGKDQSHIMHKHFDMSMSQF